MGVPCVPAVLLVSCLIFAPSRFFVDAGLTYVVSCINPTSEPAVALGCAARAGDAVKLRELASAVSVDMQLAEGWRATHEAAMNGHAVALDLLLGAGAKASAEDNRGRTPLHWATFGGHLAASLLLLDQGAMVDARDMDKQTPLHGTSVRESIEVAEVLLAVSADIGAKDWLGQTVFHSAVIDGHVSLVELLLAHGASIDVEDEEGQSPFQRAVALAQRGSGDRGIVFGLLLEEMGRRG